MTREEIIEKSVLLAQQNSKVALQWCTGLGKSYAAIRMIEVLLQDNPNFKVLLLIAELAHRENWINEFKRWNKESLLSHITIETYASLKNHREKEYQILIADEAHHAVSIIRFGLLVEMEFEKIILLSATLSKEIQDSLYMLFGKIAYFNITLRQGINWGIIPEPSIYLIPLTLDNVKKNCIMIESWGTSAKRIEVTCDYSQRWMYIKDKKKYPHLTLKIICTQQQKYDMLNDKCTYYKDQFIRTRQDYIKIKWLQLGSERKRFLGECKTEFANSFLKYLINKRYICFCSSIEQAEYLGGVNCIHSKKKDSLQIINSFNNKEINHLYAIGMLQEGQNLKDIEAGVIIQLDGQERAFIQKFGRTLRADSPKQYIMYIRNTRDQEFLTNVLENIDTNYITEVTTNEDLEL